MTGGPGGIEDILKQLSAGLDFKILQVSGRQVHAFEEQEKEIRALAAAIKAKQGAIDDLKKRLVDQYEPNGREGFLEVGSFEGYHSFEFFNQLGHLLDCYLSPVLAKTTGLRTATEKRFTVKDDEFSTSMNPADFNDKAAFNTRVTSRTLEILIKGILSFDKIAKSAYQRAIDQYRYLQKRFLNIGADDNRAYQVPWEDDERSGFNLQRVPCVKIELVNNNALLTDLLLDVADHLPTQYISKRKIKGKTKEIKHLDRFDIDRAARILVELSNPTYSEYLKKPHEYLRKITQTIKDFYSIFSSLEPRFRAVLEKQVMQITEMSENSELDIHKAIVNPAPITNRLEGINYNSIRPHEQDVKPSNQMERRHFSARKNLLEHLAVAMERISKTRDEGRKYEIAKHAVEKAVKLKEIVRKTQETHFSKRLELDKQSNNEFYVGTSTAGGEFKFVREPAPKVKMSDVHGKSFDEMKLHIEDLASYSKFLHLYNATAPRGKIRSNMIAIGPYGCGKTEIGRAIAGDKRFIAGEVTVTDMLTKWFGEFEKNVDRVWEGAMELRKNSGDSKLVCMLMDEFDSFFTHTEGHWVDETYRRVQKAIQMKLDGVVDYPGVIVVGFTNEPSAIPLSIYRRFKYVDVVGQLTKDEGSALLRKFITTGLPLTSGFTDQQYSQWGTMLNGATGDVIGKVADDIHSEFMRKFIDEHNEEGKRLQAYLRRTHADGKEVDKTYMRRTIGRQLRVTPDWVDQKIQAKLADPIIQEQIEEAKRVYAEAEKIMSDLYGRRPSRIGFAAGTPRGPDLGAATERK